MEDVDNINKLNKRINALKTRLELAERTIKGNASMTKAGMTEFYKTRAGKTYFEKTMPALIESNERLSKALEKQNKIEEKKLILEVRKLNESK